MENHLKIGVLKSIGVVVRFKQNWLCGVVGVVGDI